MQDYSAIKDEKILQSELESAKLRLERAQKEVFSIQVALDAHRLSLKDGMLKQESVSPANPKGVHQSAIQR